MPARGQRLLNNHVVRQDILLVIRNTGRYDLAYKDAGVSERTFQRYRDAHPDFDDACKTAKAYHKVQKELKHGAFLRTKALDELIKRIDEGTISDAALIRILFANGYDNPVV